MEEVMANIGSEMAASTDWSEIMNLEEVMAQKEGIVKGMMSGVEITCGRNQIELDVE